MKIPGCSSQTNPKMCSVHYIQTEVQETVWERKEGKQEGRKGRKGKTAGKKEGGRREERKFAPICFRVYLHSWKLNVLPVRPHSCQLDHLINFITGEGI